MEVDTTAVLSVVLDDGEGIQGASFTGTEALVLAFAMAIPLFFWAFRVNRQR